MGESSVPMSMTRRLVISTLVGLAIPVLALATVSLTDDHAVPSLFRSLTESIANVAFWPATFVLRITSPGFFCRDKADLTPILVSLSTISLFGIPTVSWGAVVFVLSLIGRALRRRTKPRVNGA